MSGNSRTKRNDSASSAAVMPAAPGKLLPARLVAQRLVGAKYRSRGNDDERRTVTRSNDQGESVGDARLLKGRTGGW